MITYWLWLVNWYSVREAHMKKKSKQTKKQASKQQQQQQQQQSLWIKKLSVSLLS